MYKFEKREQGWRHPVEYPMKQAQLIAQQIGLELDSDQEFRWFLNHVLQSLLPLGWREEYDPFGYIQYHNAATKKTTGKPPSIYLFRAAFSVLANSTQFADYDVRSWEVQAAAFKQLLGQAQQQDSSGFHYSDEDFYAMLLKDCKNAPPTHIEEQVTYKQADPVQVLQAAKVLNVHKYYDLYWVARTLLVLPLPPMWEVSGTAYISPDNKVYAHHPAVPYLKRFVQSLKLVESASPLMDFWDAQCYRYVVDLRLLVAECEYVVAREQQVDHELKHRVFRASKQGSLEDVMDNAVIFEITNSLGIDLDKEVHMLTGVYQFVEFVKSLPDFKDWEFRLTTENRRYWYNTRTKESKRQFPYKRDALKFLRNYRQCSLSGATEFVKNYADRHILFQIGGRSLYEKSRAEALNVIQQAIYQHVTGEEAEFVIPDFLTRQLIVNSRPNVENLLFPCPFRIEVNVPSTVVASAAELVPDVSSYHEEYGYKPQVLFRSNTLVSVGVNVEESLQLKRSKSIRGAVDIPEEVEEEESLQESCSETDSPYEEYRKLQDIVETETKHDLFLAVKKHVEERDTSPVLPLQAINEARKTLSPSPSKLSPVAPSQSSIAPSTPHSFQNLIPSAEVSELTDDSLDTESIISIPNIMEGFDSRPASPYPFHPIVWSNTAQGPTYPKNSELPELSLQGSFQSWSQDDSFQGLSKQDSFHCLKPQEVLQSRSQQLLPQQPKFVLQISQQQRMHVSTHKANMTEFDVGRKMPRNLHETPSTHITTPGRSMHTRPIPEIVMTQVPSTTIPVAKYSEEPEIVTKVLQSATHSIFNKPHVQLYSEEQPSSQKQQISCKETLIPKQRPIEILHQEITAKGHFDCMHSPEQTPSEKTKPPQFDQVSLSPAREMQSEVKQVDPSRPRQIKTQPMQPELTRSNPSKATHPTTLLAPNQRDPEINPQSDPVRTVPLSADHKTENVHRKSAVSFTSTKISLQKQRSLPKIDTSERMGKSFPSKSQPSLMASTLKTPTIPELPSCFQRKTVKTASFQLRPATRVTIGTELSQRLSTQQGIGRKRKLKLRTKTTTKSVLQSRQTAAPPTDPERKASPLPAQRLLYSQEVRPFVNCFLLNPPPVQPEVDVPSVQYLRYYCKVIGDPASPIDVNAFFTVDSPVNPTAVVALGQRLNLRLSFRSQESAESDLAWIPYLQMLVTPPDSRHVNPAVVKHWPLGKHPADYYCLLLVDHYKRLRVRTLKKLSPAQQAAHLADLSWLKFGTESGEVFYYNMWSHDSFLPTKQ